ncbi:MULTISPECIES: AAA family ATPase [unclassified Moorena]|uniref:ParA family protein n=1 Tax=unclassified Moorena TaxID=2683338 RepID=UPI00140008A2|nr:MULTISPECIES: AAA family ATPase [unclassified Moorena]NEO14586.1 AAA family ATPase [Moorena sp. SIO3E8]NEQ02360.1 AAA family ATPase [Moorena sp. SIO3F7]
MVHKIALFNHKGGVSKTTTTFNLGWMLASKGKRVILVDTDPQCNLTGMVLGFSTKKELEEAYKTNQHIKAGLEPAFESQPRLIKAVECIPIERQEGLFLLPGHVGLAEYEVTLGIAQQLSGSIQTLKNLPGSISYLLDKTADKFSADYILIDMSPSLSSINQNLLMTSNLFIIPTSPDLFSVMAIDSLATILPKWNQWAKKASELQVLKEADYPFPKVNPLFLGTIIQNYRIRNKKPSAAFQKWMDQIKDAIEDRLFPALSREGMVFTQQVYSEQEMGDDFCLIKISDFNSLIPISQEYQTPVFDVTAEQIRLTGNSLTNTLEAQSKFKESFSTLADKVINLTSNAVRA